MNFITILATTEHSGGESPFEILGINLTALLVQIVAFLVFFVILAKFVYPPIIKMLDEHEKAIKEAREAADKSQKDSEEAEAKIEKMLHDAKVEAHEIVDNAKSEAEMMIEESDKKARERAESLVATARGDIEKEVLAARKALRDETLDLVATATESVARVKIDGKKDGEIIKKAISEADKNA